MRLVIHATVAKNLLVIPAKAGIQISKSDQAVSKTV
jgi:hypothetical protein